MIEAGKLNCKVIIQSPTETQSDSGEVALSWTTHATVWANIAPLTPREITIGKNYKDTVTTKITVRYLSTITTKMRVLYGTRTFYVNGAIDPTETKEDTLLYVTEVI